MTKQKLLSHTDDMQNLLKVYKQKVPKLTNLQSPRFVQVKERFKHPEYVMTVIGAMKSGKSTFINALLGEDLMPNETEACTLTTTDIVFGKHTNEIVKLFRNGKKEKIKGSNLAEIFHKEIRGSREKKALDYRYQMMHKLHALKDQQLTNDTEFVLVDTPGINEMEGLGVQKSTIIDVFHQAIQRTDSLLYVIDYQYYKAEENVEILSLIRDVRPDLLKHLTVVVNKVDKITYKDGSISEILDEISNALNAWGISSHTLYPISARKALGARLIDSNSPQLSLHVKEIEAVLPSIDVDVGGKLVKARLNLEDASEALLEESGITKIEQELIKPIFVGILDKVIENVNKLIQSGAKETSHQVNEVITQNNQLIEEREKKIRSKQEEQQELRRLIAFHRETNLEATRQLKKEVEKWKGKENLSVFDTNIGSFPYNTYSKNYYRSNDASKEGKKQLRSWINQETEQFQEKAIFHYKNGLKFYSSNDNYFFAMNQFASKVLTALNAKLREYSRTYKGIRLVNESLSVLSPNLDETKSKIKNIDRCLSKVEVETYSESRQESFLLIFTTTRYIDRYAYNLFNAVEYTKKELKTELLALSHLLYTKYKDTKYMAFLEQMIKAVSERFNQSILTVSNEIKQIEKEIQALETEIQSLKSEISFMIELTQKVEGRSSLQTSEKIVFVNSSAELDKAIRNSSDGTIIQLDKGVYQLKNAIRLNQSIGIFGVKGGTTLELVDGFDVVGNRSVFLKELSVTFKTKKPSIRIDSYYTSIEDCSFAAMMGGTVLLELAGETQSEIVRNTFRNASTALRISSVNKVQVDECYFYKNEIGIDANGKSTPFVTRNRFTEHKSSSIKLSEYTKGIYKENLLSSGMDKGVLVKDEAAPRFERNNIIGNKAIGVFLINKTNTSFTSNLISDNGVGIKFHDFSNAELVKNEITNNRSTGVEVVDTAKVTLIENILKGNKDSGLSVRNHSRVSVVKNEIIENNKHGIILLENVFGHIQDNKILQNNVNGVSALNQSNLKASGNILSENKEAGIYGDDESWLELKNNICSKNGTGVTVKGQVKLLFVQNTCQENQKYGLSLMGKITGVIKDNELLFNSFLPIFLSEKQNIKIRMNKLKGNKWYTKLKLSYWISINRIRQSNKWHNKEHRDEQTKN